MTVRLINSVTKVVVSVSEEKATRLGDHWVPYVPEQPKRKPGRPKKSDSDDS